MKSITYFLNMLPLNPFCQDYGIEKSINIERMAILEITVHFLALDTIFRSPYYGLEIDYIRSDRA